MLYLFLSGLFAFCAPAVANEIHAQCTTSLGRAMDAAKPGASLTIEPKFSVRASERWTLRFYSLIDRPTDPHRDFTIPSIDLSLELAQNMRDEWQVGLFAQGSAVNVLNWDVDGWISRFATGPWTAWQASSWLRLEATLAPFLQFSQYSQGADGEAFSVLGIGEQVKAVVEWGRFTAEASLTLVQSRKRRWRNEYASVQQVAFAATPNLSVGLSHQLADETVSLSTGLARPFGLSDGRLSRISGFMRWRI